MNGPPDPAEGDNPFASQSTWLQQSGQGHLTATFVSIFAAVFSGILVGFISWTVIRVAVNDGFLRPAEPYALPLSIAMSGIAGLTAAWLIGQRVRQKVIHHFERISAAQLKRAAMAEQIADLQLQLREQKNRTQSAD